jgi:hypothetical protein
MCYPASQILQTPSAKSVSLDELAKKISLPNRNPLAVRDVQVHKNVKVDADIDFLVASLSRISLPDLLCDNIHRGWSAVDQRCAQNKLEILPCQRIARNASEFLQLRWTRRKLCSA